MIDLAATGRGRRHAVRDGAPTRGLVQRRLFIDIGLGDWYLPDINTLAGEDIARVLMRIVSDVPAARAKLAKAMAFVKERHRFGMIEVRRTLGLPTNRPRAFPDRVYR